MSKVLRIKHTIESNHRWIYKHRQLCFPCKFVLTKIKVLVNFDRLQRCQRKLFSVKSKEICLRHQRILHWLTVSQATCQWQPELLGNSSKNQTICNKLGLRLISLFVFYFLIKLNADHGLVVCKSWRIKRLQSAGRLSSSMKLDTFIIWLRKITHTKSQHTMTWSDRFRQWRSTW